MTFLVTIVISDVTQVTQCLIAHLFLFMATSGINRSVPGHRGGVFVFILFISSFPIPFLLLLCPSLFGGFGILKMLRIQYFQVLGLEFGNLGFKIFCLSGIGEVEASKIAVIRLMGVGHWS